jgi:hypothetical protein
MQIGMVNITMHLHPDNLKPHNMHHGTHKQLHAIASTLTSSFFFDKQVVKTFLLYTPCVPELRIVLLMILRLLVKKKKLVKFYDHINI